MSTHARSIPNPDQTAPAPLTQLAQRYAGVVRWISIALIVLGLFFLMRVLPIDRGVEALRGWVSALGFWGPAVFGLCYVLGALLFVPGSALTLAAGGIFGLLWGTITVSFASTTAAALAFLIARYIARDKVERQARRHAKFGAIDQAIGKQGWKIVAILRLTPVVPFSLGNYLFGLTAVRFWPYTLASWIAMLPGTFMYVFLGDVLRAGAVAAAGGQPEATTSETVIKWILRIVGLAATIAVTVYVTRLARRALEQETAINVDSSERPVDPQHPAGARLPARAWPWGATATGLAALLTVGLAAAAQVKSDEVRSLVSALFGPPPVKMREAYRDKPGGPTFDHSTFDELLNSHVDDAGSVDYTALARELDKLDAYIAALGQASFDELGRDEKLALLINAYNAFTLKLILEHYPIDSIMKIPASQRWKDGRWHIGDLTLSLDQIEHEQIRPRFKEPRIHFALVCAAIGCPKLRNEAYTAEHLERQLSDQARYTHSHDRWFRFQPGSDEVHLTKLYDWYRDDFRQVAGSVLDYAARYAPALEQALDAGRRPQIHWLEYDWILNDVKNRK